MRTANNIVVQELKNRKLPNVLMLQNGEEVKTARDWQVRRQEIVSLYLAEVYGSTGLDTGKVTWSVEREYDKALADKAIYQKILINYESEQGSFQFPFHLTMPKAVKKAPVFVYISFEESYASASMPLEEIIDQGYGVASLYYQDIALDIPEYKGQKLSALMPEEKRGRCGTIALWSFGASRVVDCLLEMESVDADRLAVAGHSRLGKTALWCGAMDERFAAVIANDSGAGGASLFRGTVKETLKDLCRWQINYWFNEKFLTYADRAEEIALDQHFLLSLIAPRHLYISSAADDEWADAASEFLAAVEATKVYNLLGDSGLVCGSPSAGEAAGEAPDGAEKRFPNPGDIFHEGKIGHHLRSGNHFLSRYDWNQIIAYRNLHGC